MKLHSLLLLALVAITTSFTQPVRAQNTEVAVTEGAAQADAAAVSKICSNSWNGRNFKQLNNTIYKPTQDNFAKDNQQALVQSDFQLLKSAFLTLDKSSLEKIFEGPNAITFNDIDSLWFAVKSKKIKAKPGFISYLTVLRDLGYDHPSLFNGKSDAVERIQQVLNNSPQRANLVGVQGDAQKWQLNTKKTVENLIIQAMMEMRGKSNASTRLLDGYRNTFDPHLERIQKLVKVYSDLLSVVDMTFVPDEPVAYFNSLYAADFLPAEKDVINRLLGDTKGKLDATFGAANETFSTDLIAGNVEIGDVRLRELETKLEALKSAQKLSNAVADAERDMDDLERVVKAVRKRKGLIETDYTEMHDRQLQIRYAQHARVSGELKDHYVSLINRKVKGADYTVHASWTVRVKHEEWVTKIRFVTTYDSQGKANGTRPETYQVLETSYSSYPMNEKFTLTANYSELLNGEIKGSVAEVEAQ